jgi:hypothetical protein
LIVFETLVFKQTTSFMRYFTLGVLFFWILMSACRHQTGDERLFMDLSGTWKFSLDSADVGIKDKWYAKRLEDSIDMPGTTDLGHKGTLNKDTTTMHLNRIYLYEGPAWYQKSIEVPQNFKGKHIVLILERTKCTWVWIDNQPLGGSRLLQTPQCFDASELLTPGKHRITIRVDNSRKLTPYGNVHIYSDDTQTNWNGIIGNILLEASSKTYISDLQVYPDVEKKKIDVKMMVDHPKGLETVEVLLQVQRIFKGRTDLLKTRKYKVRCDSAINLEYKLGNDAKLWDEYRQPLYRLTASISGEGFRDSKTVPFGMRKFTARGTQFAINGRTVFLRGKHEACVFPLTGFPPMEVDDWERVFSIAKSYGINHYRFHSYCPPEAAFIAADRTGIYIQVELPFWGGLDNDSTADMLKAEGMAMLKCYANHPSFVLFSHGNEIWGGHERVEKNILALKAYDNRPLYTMGSNNNIGYAEPRPCSDFFVAARTPYAYDTILTHTRLTHCFADSKEGGILNTRVPSTEITFDYAISHIKIPIISHEIGQYQVYPDYREIEKYKGVLKANNLVVFEKRLKSAGMLDQDLAFQKASGAWSALCYKAEMEAALRTSGLAGFQLLDLQDYPGQGTALVGMLDAFMDDKGVVDRQEWLQSCNDVVVLLKFPKYCYTNTEKFQADVEVVNYSNQTLNDEIQWEATGRNGKHIQSGTLGRHHIPNTGLTRLGTIIIPLTSVKDADELTLKVWLKTSGYNNTYPIWVYPGCKAEKPDSVIIAEKLDKEVLSWLHQGRKVLLFPQSADVKKNSVKGLFPPEFWNYGMFKGISEWVKKPVSPGTLGILTKPEHPVFKSFPTDSHTNWQWFSIIKASNPLILNKTKATYRPIVQVIDNLERNDKLGLIFEFKVGDRGKLLVCMAQLTGIMEKPEACQLYNSIIDYMNSKDFHPDYPVDDRLLKELFQ